MATDQTEDSISETLTLTITNGGQILEVADISDAPDVGRCETVMDLSIKKPKTSFKENEQVEFDSKSIEEGAILLNTLSSAETEGGGNYSTSKRSRSKKRKRPPQKCSQNYEASDYVLEQVEDEHAENGEVTGLDTEDKNATNNKSLTLSESDSHIAANILASSLITSNGKSVRPFKLYTAQNRDLLAGLTLNTNINNIAAAFSGLPVSGVPNTNSSPCILGAAGAASLSISTMPPNPLIPVTIPTGVASSSTTLSSANNSLFSVPTSVITATSSSSAMHLMTLATEADKIRREKLLPKMQENGLGTEDKVIRNGNKVSSLLLTNIDPSGKPVTAELNADGTFNLTVESGASDETLALIHERATAAVQAILRRQSDEELEKKKKRSHGPMPDDMKTSAYWERRRKNNEAAKRSRDARRSKEDQIAIRAALLEQENIALKIEIASLKEEVRELRSVIINGKKQENGIKGDS